MNIIISSCTEELVSNVYSNEGIDSGETEKNQVIKRHNFNTKSGFQELPAPAQPQRNILQFLIVCRSCTNIYTASDQTHLKCKFMEIECDDATDKPELDPY